MTNHNTLPPVALTIAGSDSSAGAGIQADLKTFAAMGTYGVNAITAIVAEAPGSVSSTLPVEAILLRSQLEQVRQFFSPVSIKTGMLANEEIVDEVARFARENSSVPLVIDPVLCASAGTPLLSDAGRKRLQKELLPLATLVTPNLPEAEILLRSRVPVAESARALYEQYGSNFLVKGGHGDSESDHLIDYACIDGEGHEFAHPRLAVPDLHGTGCTLSAAIAARLAHGDCLTAAIERGIEYLGEAMKHHFHWPDADASRALNHFPYGVGSEES